MNPDAVRIAFCAAVLTAVDAMESQVPDGSGAASGFTEAVRLLAAGLRATDALSTATCAVRALGAGTVV